MTVTKKTIHSFVNLELIRDYGYSPEQAITLSEMDYRKYETLTAKYAYIASHEIAVEMPHNIGGVAADSLEVELQKMRANHHKEEQQLIDLISTMRLLEAPKEGEIVDDKDLRQASSSKFHDAKDADEGDFTDVPF